MKNNFFAVCWDECGDELIMHPREGETRHQLGERIRNEHPEIRLRYMEEPVDWIALHNQHYNSYDDEPY